MKRSITVLFLFQTFTSLLFSQGTFVSGYVSGEWDKQSSPYIVTSSLNIHEDSSLVIKPGVEVIFATLNGLNIKGRLTAKGLSEAC